MSRHTFTFRCVDVVPMMAFALDVRKLCAQAALTVTGYLRPRPDPALENALRAAFADLDRDLAGILEDRRRNRQ